MGPGARGAGCAACGSGSGLGRAWRELGGEGGSASSPQYYPPPSRDSPNSGGPDWLGGAGELAGGRP